MSEDRRLEKALEAAGLRWPAPTWHYAVVDSTNDRLKDRAREGAPEWSIVLADAQTAGHGRHGRRWASPPGNLYLSVLLRPSFAAVPLLPLAAGVAVVEAVAPLGVAAALKWPNDVLVGERKLAGILAEASSGPSGLDWVVLGLGVNVAVEPPVGATSIRAETGRATDRAELAASVLARLTVWYHALADNGPAPVLEAWRARCLSWWGRLVEARSGDEVVRGVARDVDARGALLLELPGGERRAIVSGDVEEVRLACS